MEDYIETWKQMSAQSASISARIGEGLLVTMFVESQGDRSTSSFETAFFALSIRDDLTWSQEASRLKRECASRRDARLTGESSQDKALVAQQNKRPFKSKFRGSSSGSGVECRHCGKTGQIKSKCLKRKRYKSGEDAK